jgi:TetR/AcrR family tetracycline transcriptional repressor
MPGLSRDRIIHAGLGLLDRAGPDGLTMRSLAGELDVTAAAIYYHFPGREAVLEGIVAHLAGQILSSSARQGSWREQLEALLVTMVEEASSHPPTIAWLITEYARRPPVLQIHERILAILHDAGFAPEAAIRTKGTLLRFCAGHLILNVAAPELDWREVPQDAYATYRAVKSQVSHIDHGELFRLGLDILITGLGDRFSPS